MRVCFLSVILGLLLLGTAPASDLEEVSRVSVGKGKSATPYKSSWYSTSSTRLQSYTIDNKLIVNQRVRLNERTMISDNGGHFGILKYNDHSPTTFSALRFDLYDSGGQKLWSVSKPGAVSFVVSDASAMAIGIIGGIGMLNSEVVIYSSNGEATSGIPVRELKEVRFSPSASMIFVNSADSGLVSYDTLGNKLRVFGPAHAFSVSHSGEEVAAATPSGPSYFSSGMRSKASTSNPGNSGSEVAIVLDQALSVAGFLYPNALKVYSLPAMKMEWEFNLHDTNRKLTSLDISPDFIAIGYDSPSTSNGETEHTEGGVMLFSRIGEQLLDHPLSYDRWSRQFPAVKFASHEDTILVCTATDVYMFRIVR